MWKVRLPWQVYFLSYECDNSFSNKLGFSLKQLLHACKWRGFTTIIIIPLQGQCYVMTANLDGETSLKTRHSASLTKVQHKNLGIWKTSKSNFKGAMVARQVHKLVGCPLHRSVPPFHPLKLACPDLESMLTKLVCVACAIAC